MALATPRCDTQPRVSAHRLPSVTVTVKVVCTVVVLPDRSVAVAVSVCVPSPKLYAGPEAVGQVVAPSSTPPSSVAVQEMLTIWSTVYVPALPPKVMVGGVTSFDG